MHRREKGQQHERPHPCWGVAFTGFNANKKKTARPGTLVGRGAARDRAIQPFVSKLDGAAFLLMHGAGLGAWVLL